MSDESENLFIEDDQRLETYRRLEAFYNRNDDANEQEWLFRRLLAAYNDNDDDEARLLCYQILKLTGGRNTDALKYLQLLDQRAEEPIFAEALHLLRLRHYRHAVRKFHVVADLNRRRSREADSYLQMAEPFLISLTKPDIPAFSDSLSTQRGPEALIKRIPHMNLALDGQLLPEANLTVSVFVDQISAREGEHSDELTFPMEPPITSLTVQVQLLATHHFNIEGDRTRSILIKRDEDRSESAVFKLKIKRRVELEASAHDQAGLTAVFTYNGRIAGKVVRLVEIASEEERATVVNSDKRQPPNGAPVEPHISFDVNANPADLIVEIVSKPINNGREFTCTVRTALLELDEADKTQDWNLPEVTKTIVTNVMAEFASAEMGKQQRLAELRGAGIDLFRASPDNFQKIFWKLIDANRIPRTISIVSEEPYFPWELMIPNRRINGHPRKRAPLGVEFTMARWTPETAVSASQKINMTDCYVIAPNYQDRRALKHAQAESQFLLQKYPAPKGQAIKPADFTNIDNTFRTGSKTIVHFACHGSLNESGEQVIFLESEPPLSPQAVLGMETLESAFLEKKPFVFINACEVGRLVPSLSGVGGFAQTFIDLGASAVIAPLWSVKDDLAHEVARTFYNEISRDSSKPFAEILREIRERAYDPQIAEDTYAAYCFYGDPLSSIAD
jgi:hypothetical protein